MIDTATKHEYVPTIGIECHVQLKTSSKLFAAVGNDARHAAPNTLISHICLGMPGALPVLNNKVVDLAVRFAAAVNTKPQPYSYFERKHYFYPDLPKGYQITQLEQPIIKGGYVEIEVDGQSKKVQLNRVQIEEDAGKSTHPAGKDYSLVDLNRAGTPLFEIVSEPDMHSAIEAKTYAKELYLLVRYADISDADLYHGNMRFDVNVSVCSDPGKLGTRTETKNLNSFRSVEKAVDYEINRQIELLQKGETVVQETRGWDDAKQKTFSQRGKEEAHDYRYFPDPDLPPIVITEADIEQMRDAMPVMPSGWRRRLAQLGLNASQTDTLLEAEIEDERLSYLGLIESSLDQPELAKTLANWFVNIEIPLRRSAVQINSAMDNEQRLQFLTAVYALVRDDKLSSTAAKALLSEVLKSGAEPKDIEKYAAEQGFLQVSDESELEKIVEAVLTENPKAAEDIRNGETKAIGFLVGQVMKKSQGKANPGLAQSLIKKLINR